MCRGGTLITRLRIWPCVTASKCSMIASMCQPGTNGVWGSMTSQAWRTNSRRLRVASSRSTFARALGLANQGAKLLEFVIGKLRKLGRRTDLDRSAARATMFVAEVVFVSEKILG